MATEKPLTDAEITRIQRESRAGMEMAGEEQLEESRRWGRRVLLGEVTAEDAIAARFAEIRAGGSAPD